MQDTVVKQVEELNKDPTIDGILVQVREMRNSNSMVLQTTIRCLFCGDVCSFHCQTS